MSTLATGQVAPVFELPGTDGREHSLQAALSRGPVLASFFKVSCPTCQYTFPFLERLYQQFREQGVQIWGISQDDARNSQGFARDYGLTFPILIDDYPYRISRQYRVEYVPTLFWIAPDGKIKVVSEGFAKTDLLTIQKSFAQFFSAKPEALFRPNEKVPEYKPG
jgi:peroxiredoxin